MISGLTSFFWGTASADAAPSMPPDSLPDVEDFPETPVDLTVDSAGCSDDDLVHLRKLSSEGDDDEDWVLISEEKHDKKSRRRTRKATPTFPLRRLRHEGPTFGDAVMEIPEVWRVVPEAVRMPPSSANSWNLTTKKKNVSALLDGAPESCKGKVPVSRVPDKAGEVPSPDSVAEKLADAMDTKLDIYPAVTDVKQALEDLESTPERSERIEQRSRRISECERMKPEQTVHEALEETINYGNEKLHDAFIRFNDFQINVKPKTHKAKNRLVIAKTNTVFKDTEPRKLCFCDPSIDMLLRARAEKCSIVRAADNRKRDSECARPRRGKHETDAANLSPPHKNTLASNAKSDEHLSKSHTVRKNHSARSTLAALLTNTKAPLIKDKRVVKDKNSISSQTSSTAKRQPKPETRLQKRTKMSENCLNSEETESEGPDPSDSQDAGYVRSPPKVSDGLRMAKRAMRVRRRSAAFMREQAVRKITGEKKLSPEGSQDISPPVSLYKPPRSDGVNDTFASLYLWDEARKYASKYLDELGNLGWLHKECKEKDMRTLGGSLFGSAQLNKALDEAFEQDSELTESEVVARGRTLSSPRPDDNVLANTDNKKPRKDVVEVQELKLLEQYHSDVRADQKMLRFREGRKLNNKCLKKHNAARYTASAGSGRPRRSDRMKPALFSRVNNNRKCC